MKQYYIGDGVFNHKSDANYGYVHKIDNKKEQKDIKKKGYIFFKSYEKANNFRLADILGG